jgi:hypothetical protein
MRADAAVREQTRTMRIALIVSAGLAAGAGLQLFAGTESTDRFFAWTIKPPLTAAFLGAMYLGALVLTALAARETAWANARISFIASACLVPLLFVVTMVHLERFHTDSDDVLTLVGTWIFITTYGWLPLLLLAGLVTQSRAPGVEPPRRTPLAGWMRATLAVHATLLGGLGLALLVAPTSVDRLWPWDLTPLTGRAAGAWLLSVGVAAAAGFRENDIRRLRVPFVAYVTLAILASMAVARYPGTPDWSHPAAWAIFAVLASMLVVGALGLLAERPTDAFAPGSSSWEGSSEEDRGISETAPPSGARPRRTS